MTGNDDELVRHLERRSANRPSGDQIRSIAWSVAGTEARRQPLRWRGAVGAAAVVVAIATIGAATLMLGSPSSPPASSIPSQTARSTPATSATAATSASPVEPSVTPPQIGTADWASIAWVRGDASLFAYDHHTYLMDAVAWGSGFVAVGYTIDEGGNILRVWQSADGRAWSVLAPDVLHGLVPVRIGVVGGRLVLLADRPIQEGASASQMETWVSDDGAAWRPGPSAPRGIDADSQTPVGPLGVLARGGGLTAWLDPDVTAWSRVSRTGSSPALRGGVLSAGRDGWFLSGASGSTKSVYLATVGGIWTSADADQWQAADVADPGGAIGPIHIVDGGYVAIGTERGLACDGCLGAIDLTQVAWWSADGGTWRRVDVAGEHDGDPLWGSRSVGDGHRLITISGARVVAAGDAAHPPKLLLETIDGRTWTGIAVAKDRPSPAFQGPVAVGPSGIVAFDAIQAVRNDPTAFVPWFGAATEAP